jgi:hypothetical protein
VIHTGVYDPMNGGDGDLSLNFSLWSNGFQKLGYSTHAIGKVRCCGACALHSAVQCSADSSYTGYTAQ